MRIVEVYHEVILTEVYCEDCVYKVIELYLKKATR